MARSVMVHQFSQVPRAEIPRSRFDRSHGYKTTFDSGWLVPIFVDEALPGDTFSLKCHTFARLSTPLHPIMDNLFSEVFFFAVPYRLVWTHFVNFFGEQANPADSTSFLVPQVVLANYPADSLQDYMGLPVGLPVTHNNLHMRAYNLIWNQWFRDQNQQNSVVVDTGDGPDLPQNYQLLRRGKRFDYFTSCLPFPQKGPAVTIPLGGLAAIKGLAVTTTASYASPATGFLATGSATTPPGNDWAAAGAGGLAVEGDNVTKIPKIYADLSTATAATINSLRQAFQIQKIYERDARGGTRYTELIHAHFGVSSPDARLQRAEFLGGGSTRININPIAQTSATTTGATPQGNLAAMGVFSHGGYGFTKSFTEHCLLLGLINVRADLTYQQGLDRMWTRQTRFDYYWPALSHIGEQAVLNQEIMFQNNPAVDTAAFGYQERYAEYRYKPSRVTGQFRSNFAQPLDSWHLSQTFATLPVLGATWIVDNPPIARIVAVPSQPQFLLDVYFELHCARPMPIYGVPGDMDRF